MLGSVGSSFNVREMGKLTASEQGWKLVSVWKIHSFCYMEMNNFFKSKLMKLVKNAKGI